MRRRVLTALLAIAVAVVGHFSLATFAEPLAPAFDLFLVVTLLLAIRGGELEGMLAGIAAGVIADTISGGPFGLHGFTLTLTGYLVGLAAQRVAEMTEVAAGILAATGALMSRALLLALTYLFVSSSPVIIWWFVPAVIGSSLVLVWLVRLAGAFGIRMGGWQRSRQQGRLKL